MSKRSGDKDILERANLVANRLANVPMTMDDELPYHIQTPVDAAMDALGAVIDAIELIEQRDRIERAKIVIIKQQQLIADAERRIAELSGS